MKQLGIKGKVVNLQTSVKKSDDDDSLEATFKFSSPGVAPKDLQQLFHAQRAGHLEFTIASQLLELFSSREAEADPSKAPFN